MFGHVSSSIYLVGADHLITVGSLLFPNVISEFAKWIPKVLKKNSLPYFGREFFLCVFLISSNSGRCGRKF